MKRGWVRLVRAISLGLLTLFSGTISAGGEAFLHSSQQAGYDSGLGSNESAAAGRMLQTMQDGERIRVIVQLNTSFVPEGKIGRASGIRDQRAVIASGQDHVAKTLGSSGSIEIHRFRTVPLVVLEVDAAGLTALMNDPAVRSIREDKPVLPTLGNVVPYIGADQIWLEGVAGAGQAVVVLDTGVDTDHSFLAGKTVSEACYSSTDTFMGSTSLCPAGDNPAGADSQVGTGAAENCDLSIAGCDHGTHVAGIAVGSGTTFSGVAPDADLIAIQIFSEFSGTYCTESGVGSPCAMSYTSDQIRGLERVYELRATYSIAAVNMSLGGDLYTDEAACDIAETDLKYIIDQLRSVDIPVVVSAGNGSSRSGLSSPACISTAISVGSVTLSDQVSSFSNTSSFLDFYAPGSGVNSSLPGNLFGYKSGTSMAAPEVAGAFALLKSAFPGATVDELYAAMADTGVLVDDLRSSGTVTEIPRIQLDDAYYSLIPTVFEDVSANHWAVDYIEALFNAGYISGCSAEPRLYCPD
ncbi:MAG: S8 family serine peptidase, partial [Anaerolineales bacterium]|nr:S8 family serine peptidase [Anaerolineales bacterium]